MQTGYPANMYSHLMLKILLTGTVVAASLLVLWRFRLAAVPSDKGRRQTAAPSLPSVGHYPTAGNSDTKPELARLGHALNTALSANRTKDQPRERHTALTLPLPASLKDVPRTPELDAGLREFQRLRGDSQQAMANIDYKLARLTEIADCVEGRISQGYAHVQVQFKPRNRTDGLVSEKVEIQKGTTLPEDEPIARECIEAAVEASTLPIVDRAFQAAGLTVIFNLQFPVENTGIYTFLHTGDVRYTEPSYDARPPRVQ